MAPSPTWNRHPSIDNDDPHSTAHDLPTRTAWTEIPTAEAHRIISRCRAASVAVEASTLSMPSERDEWDHRPGIGSGTGVGANTTRYETPGPAEPPPPVSHTGEARFNVASVTPVPPSLASPSSHSYTSFSALSPANTTTTTVPCYNRRTLYDAEWQAHMKDVHGLFLLWPDRWVARVRVLDLAAWQGDIERVNGHLMGGGLGGEEGGAG